MTSAGFEPTISAGDRPQTYTLDRTATGTGLNTYTPVQYLTQHHAFFPLTLTLPMSYIYIYVYMERLFLMFLDHTQRRSTVGRTPLDE